MSLLVNTDYLVHQLRAAYLRHSEDPFAPRVVSFNPRYSSNPYIKAAGLADPARWPELERPVSPELATQDFHPTRPGPSESSAAPEAGIWPGATGLKYTQTILGPSRTGAVGMRVSGRRFSASKTKSPLNPVTSTPTDSRTPRLRSDSEPTPVTAPDSPAPPVAVHLTVGSQESIPEESLTKAKRRSLVIPSPISPSPSTGLVSPSPKLRSPQGPEGSKPAETSPTADTSPEAPATPASVHELRFIPRFARGAEMEARRRMRLRARFPGAGVNTSGTVSPPLRSPELPPPRRSMSDGASINDPDPEAAAANVISDSDDDDDVDDDDDDDDDDERILMDADQGSVDHDDEFDAPDFINPTFDPRPLTPNGSDEVSVLSAQSVLSSSFQFSSNMPARNRLSPVNEGLPTTTARRRATIVGTVDAARRYTRADLDSFLPPTPPVQDERPQPEVPLVRLPTARATKVEVLENKVAMVSSTNVATIPPRPIRSSMRPPLDPKASVPSFTRQEVTSIPARPAKSLLSQMLAAQSSGGGDNPFTELYGSISSRTTDSSSSLSMKVWFPHSKKGGEITSIDLKVRKDATVEEVIGYSLWAYWDQGIEPSLDQGLPAEGEPGDEKRKVRLSATGWTLRLVEEDGEVDEDFPAPDRTAHISKFRFDEFAVCEATPAQIKQNLEMEAKINRRPSRLMITKRSRSDLSVPTTAHAPTPSHGQGPSASATLSSSDIHTSSVLTGVTGAAAASAMTAQGPPVFLKIRVAETADAHYYSTTVSATPDTYMQDVLDLVCRKRRLPDTKEWVLLLDDMSIVIPLDRMVSSLQGKKDLVLYKRVLLEGLGIGRDRRLGKTTDPSASIFKRHSDQPGAGSGDLNSAYAYKKYTVHRKMPMLVGRHERTLAIDGNYIHILPSGPRAFLDSMKTTSFHIQNISYCKQSKKGMSTIRFVIWKDGGNKSYEFEAESPELAAEIVATVKALRQKTLERTSTINKPKTRRRPKLP